MGNAQRDWSQSDSRPNGSPGQTNALRTFFNQHKNGRGIWKFDHYFDIYERHLSRFRHTEVNVLEIGVYSGGSLEMWKHYFGPLSHIFGVDIEPACRTYEDESVKIFIGSQGDRAFWKRFKQEVENLDIVIDDCSHQAEDQIISFEELLPHLRPGGTYLCEDITHSVNPFALYLNGFSHNLNELNGFEQNHDNSERRQVCRATPFQAAINSVHLYPYATVVERSAEHVTEFIAPKHGTHWQPFLK